MRLQTKPLEHNLRTQRSKRPWQGYSTWALLALLAVTFNLSPGNPLRAGEPQTSQANPVIIANPEYHFRAQWPHPESTSWHKKETQVQSQPYYCLCFRHPKGAVIELRVYRKLHKSFAVLKDEYLLDQKADHAAFEVVSDRVFINKKQPQREGFLIISNLRQAQTTFIERTYGYRSKDKAYILSYKAPYQVFYQHEDTFHSFIRSLRFPIVAQEPEQKPEKETPPPEAKKEEPPKPQKKAKFEYFLLENGNWGYCTTDPWETLPDPAKISEPGDNPEKKDEATGKETDESQNQKSNEQDQDVDSKSPKAPSDKSKKETYQKKKLFNGKSAWCVE